MFKENIALSLSRVSKRYDRDRRPALVDVTLEVEQGKKVAIIGRSGSGKSTLLHLSAGIDLPSSGSIEVLGERINESGETARTLFRRNNIGLIFQFFYLLPHLSVADNVALPELIAGTSTQDFDQRVEELLGQVDLLDRRNDSVDKLSGGEMQRVAICRALLRKPRLLLADEPTGNLDDDNARIVMQLMIAMAEKEESTLVYVTHSAEMATLADDIWTLHSGILER